MASFAAQQQQEQQKPKKILGKSFRLFDFAVRDDREEVDDQDEDDQDEDEEDEEGEYQSTSKKAGPKAFVIQMFGINERGDTCSITVRDVQPFFFIKGGTSWTKEHAATVLRLIRNMVGGYHASSVLGAEIVQRHKLYGFTGGRTYPFVQLTFRTVATMNQVKRLWIEGNNTGRRKPVELAGVKCELYESNIPPLLRFFHIHNISPSGWIFLRMDNHVIQPRKKKTSCTFECHAPLRNIISQPDKETRVPFKICSFDIEASSSHGDFPLPVKTYKRLASNLMDVALRRLPTQIDGNVIKRVILTAFGMDQLENVDRVFPKDMPTKETVKTMLTRLLSIPVHKIVEEGSREEVRTVLEIDRMFSLAAAGGGDDEDNDDDDEPDVYRSRRFKPPQKTEEQRLTLAEVVNHPTLSRDVKIQVINESLTYALPLLEGDQVTYIGSTFLRYGDPEPYLSHCLVVGACDPVDGVVLEHAATERDMLLQWRQLLLRENPDVVIGYNIFGFDYEFVFRRSQETGCVDEFLKLSRNVEELSVASSFRGGGGLALENTKIVLATGEYDLRYPKLTGRLQIDLYTYFRRDFNLASYKLDDVASSNICDDIHRVILVPDHPVHGNVTQLYSRNLTGLHVGDYIHIELSGFTSDYYHAPTTGQYKFRVVELSDTGTILIPNLLQDLLTLEGGKKLKWGVAKDDMTPQDIFRLSQGSTAERALVAKYCVQDCNLVHHLMRKLDVITGFSEMARICSVPMSFLVFRGQGIKLTSFVAKKCRDKNTLMPDLEKSAGDEGYEGAIVLPPKCSMYMDNPVACVDYSSLYPSSMISQNYSHDSKVWTKEYDLTGALIHVTGQRDRNGQFIYDNLPGFQYIDVEFDTYKAIRKTPTSRPEKTVCGKKVCRWAQLPDGQKSIMPAILEELLMARKKTRKAAEQETDPFMANILDKRQLGYKVTANSLYGQCGAKTSTFYEQDVAASTTATGRAMIMYAKHMVEDVYGHRVVPTLKHGAVLCNAEYVYGDSVAAWTPVYVRIHGEKLDILTISQVAVKYGDNVWIPMLDKEVCELYSIESWSDKGWTPLHRVIRHRLAIHKKMFRVQTRYGLVDVTDDHSLLHAGSAAELSPRDVVVGVSTLLHHPLPLHGHSDPSPDDWDYGDDDFDDVDDDDIDVTFCSMATKWTLQNASDHARAFPKAYCTMGAETQLEAAHLIWMAAAKHGWTHCSIAEGYRGAYHLSVHRLRPHFDNNNDDDVVQSMRELTREEFASGDYVYDLTTDNHHFSAGAGTLVVHNTDSVFFTFNLENPDTGDKIRGQPALEVTIEIAQDVAKLCTQFLKPPMELSYEKTLMPFILLSKKRYVGMLYETNPHKGKLKYMGLSLKRRDSCDYLKDVYGGILNILMKSDPATTTGSQVVENAIAFLDQALTTLILGQVPMDKLTVTKALRSDYKNPLQIGHWVLAERMGQRDAGNKPKPGDRMRFVFIQASSGQGGKKPLMGDRIETPEFVASHPHIKVDYAHYITNQLMKPLQQLFGLALVPIWESRNKVAAIRSYQRDLVALERESGGDLEVYMKKKEKYCSEKIKTLIFEKFLVQISNDQQRLQCIMSFFAPKM